MAKVKALIRLERPKKDGSHTIYIFTCVNSENVYINTGVSVLPNNWDADKQHIIGQGKAVKDGNIIINDCKARLSDIFVKYRLRHEELTGDLLRKEYANPTAGIDFYSFWEREQKFKKDLNAYSTIKQHTSVLNKLKEFRASCAFSELTVDFLNDFKKFCKKTKNNVPGTINKNLKVIKVYVMKALQQDIISKSPFDTIKLGTFRGDRCFLETQELKKLIEVYNKNWLPVNQQKTLRAFLFSCFTGVRISDIKLLKHEHVINDQLIFMPQKTQGFAKIVRVPLKNAALQLINDAKLDTATTLFPMYSDQKTNKLLKAIADNVSIDKPITFHSGRHTFATTFLRLGGRVEVLQKLLGHSNIQETMIYVHIVDEDIDNQMCNFNTLWD